MSGKNHGHPSNQPRGLVYPRPPVPGQVFPSRPTVVVSNNMPIPPQPSVVVTTNAPIPPRPAVVVTNNNAPVNLHGHYPRPTNVTVPNYVPVYSAPRPVHGLLFNQHLHGHNPPLTHSHNLHGHNVPPIHGHNSHEHNFHEHEHPSILGPR